MFRVYIVVEQWPFQEIACFRSLADAEAFRVAATHLALPITISRML